MCALPAPTPGAPRSGARRRRDDEAAEPSVVGPGESRAVRAPRLLAGQRGRDDRARHPHQVDDLVGRDLSRPEGRRPAARDRRASRRRIAGSGASRTTPQSADIVRCTAPRNAVGLRRPLLAEHDRIGRRHRRSGGSESTPAIAPVGSGPSLPATIAVTTRRPNTSPSSSEFDARRFAPCTPLHAVSPHAQRCGSVVAPSRSVTTPPER